MISIKCEQVIPMSKVGDHCPRRRGGKKVHMTTGIRWAKTGCVADGGTRVYLETIRVGGTLCSSVEALQRFFERLSAQPECHAPQPAEDRTTSIADRRRQERVEQELAALGV
jgi:Protein of unknown function (DUF1580)